jgi:flavin-dependent dehydrogenase
LVLFFDGSTAAFDAIRVPGGSGVYNLLGMPANVPLLHVDRVGLDRALFETVIGDASCQYLEERPISLDYHSADDRVDAIRLASGHQVGSSYVFDATNHTRFVARRVGVPYHQIGAPRRVVFAHYRRSDTAAPSGSAAGPSSGLSLAEASVPWTQATALLRLERRTDPIDGLAWCIPLGDYVSVGVSVNASKVSTNAALLLDWVESAYGTRGIHIRVSFAERGVPVDARYEHYTHERCHGTNWLLAGPTCCQIWFPSAAGVATGLVAARLAPDLVWDAGQVAPVYQAYLDEVVASHSGLEWPSIDDPWSMSETGLREQANTMIQGSARSLASYLALQGIPSELAFGDALSRMYESDRVLASPVRISRVSPEAQAVRAFAPSDRPDPWTDAPIRVPVLTRAGPVTGPSAVLGLVDTLSGRRDIGGLSDLVAPDVEMRIDEFRIQGLAQLSGWVSLLRNSTRIAHIELVAGALTGNDTRWTLTAQWQGIQAGQQAVSPPFSLAFNLSNERVAMIQTERADYTFVLGDSILRRVAFAALLGRLATSVPA